MGKDTKNEMQLVTITSNTFQQQWQTSHAVAHQSAWLQREAHRTWTDASGCACEGFPEKPWVQVSELGADLSVMWVTLSNQLGTWVTGKGGNCLILVLQVTHVSSEVQILAKKRHQTYFRLCCFLYNGLCKNILKITIYQKPQTRLYNFFFFFWTVSHYVVFPGQELTMQTRLASD